LKTGIKLIAISALFTTVKRQYNDDVSLVFATSPFTSSSCRERFILQANMVLWYWVKFRNSENVRLDG